jgi:hypothetical protein
MIILAPLENESPNQKQTHSYPVCNFRGINLWLKLSELQIRKAA